MNSQQEANPHFLPHFVHVPDQRARRPQHTPTHLHGQNFSPTPHPPDHRIPPAHHTPHPDIPPIPPQPHPTIHPKTRTHGKHAVEIPSTQPHQGRRHFGEHGSHQQQQQQGRQNVGQQGQPPFRVTTSRKAKPIAWLIAAFCTIFWIIVIVGGLTVLIIYLVYRPRLPKFDISTANLNAAYLDSGFLLNSDLTLLGNFTNPNKKVKVEFSYVVMDLYYERNLIATRHVEPFTTLSGESIFQNIHMVTSQVMLSFRKSQDLQRQINNGSVTFDVKGLFRARSNLGGVLRYSYWLYSHCTITMAGPPAGVLIGKKCTTKR